MTGVRPLALVGPTGTGKSELALRVADRLAGELPVEVVNADGEVCARVGKTLYIRKAASQ